MKKVIGITGGIASGKSNIINVIKNQGYLVLSCDEIVSKLSIKGGKIYNNIINTFGPEYVKDNLELDKEKLGKLIFNDSSKKELLNSITHPLVKEELLAEINKSNDSLIFAEIPLLYEAKFNDICDLVIVSYLSKDEQIKRLCFRDNIDITYAKAKINSQMDLEIKKNLADFVIDTKGSFEETEKQVLEVLDKIKEMD